MKKQILSKGKKMKKGQALNKAKYKRQQITQLLKANKKMVAIGAVAACIVVGGVVGCVCALHDSAEPPQTKTETTAQIDENTMVTIIDKETGKTIVVRADSEKAKKAMNDPNKIVVENQAYAERKAQAEKSNDTADKTEATKEAKTESKTKEKSTNEQKSESKETSRTTQTQVVEKPHAHVHVWKPVYTSETKYRTKQQVERYVTVCNVCGAEISDIDQHDTETGHYDYKTGVPVYKDVQVPYTVQVLSYYQCSCGATK